MTREEIEDELERLRGIQSDYFEVGPDDAAWDAYNGIDERIAELEKMLEELK